MSVYEIQFIDAHCSKCDHYKSMHVTGVGCMACSYLQMLEIQGKIPPQFLRPFCMERFTNSLTISQIEDAKKVSPLEWPNEMPCAHCGEPWMAHTGALCPNLATLFEPMLPLYDPAFISG